MTATEAATFPIDAISLRFMRAPAHTSHVATSSLNVCFGWKAALLWSRALHNKIAWWFNPRAEAVSGDKYPISYVCR